MTQQLVRTFGTSALLTAAVALLVTVFGGFSALWLFLVLAILEITFSFDNAIINSRVLTQLSARWQKLFLTVGIIFAVFIIRFLLPIFIVMATTGLHFDSVLNLALRDPVDYAAELATATPVISAFGGSFLLLIGLSYFIDREKNVHWLKPIEKQLSRLGSIQFIKLIVMAVVGVILYYTVDSYDRGAIIWAAIFGVGLNLGLQAISQLFDERINTKKVGKQVGFAAFVTFLYLEILDASFSFDGVIGAFVITSSVLLIVAGLGAGALWVRSMTIYLTRAGTLAKYRYLEHGAHWAILVLGLVMLAKLYHVELPQWLSGSLGLIFIVAALISSILEKRNNKRFSKKI